MKSTKLPDVISMPERKEPTSEKTLNQDAIDIGFNSCLDILKEKKVGLSENETFELIYKGLRKPEGCTSIFKTQAVAKYITQILCNSADEVIMEVKE